MKLLEYEAKALLKQYQLPIPRGTTMQSPQGEVGLGFPLVVKVQIPKGGRGKAGGVRVVYDGAELQQTAAELLSQPSIGCEVKTLLAEQALETRRELYLSIVFDRAEQSLILLAHKGGGIDIEAASSTQPPLRTPLQNAPSTKLTKSLAAYFELPAVASKQLPELLKNLWHLCVEADALLIEVNPLILTKSGELVCADAKIELDDAAAFRHEWRFEAKPASTQFVVLNKHGTVASMANGAGLAMATVDAIKAASAEPANFFDVGGGTNVAGMIGAFEKMSALPQVKAIVVNIFGGITRCDEVAEAIIKARKTVANLPELFIRLTGTNEAEGRRLLENAGLPILPSLAECVAAATSRGRDV